MNPGGSDRVQAVEMNGNQYVPLAQAVGGNVDWDNNTKQATLTTGGRTIQIRMADENVTVDGQTVRLSAPPLVRDDTLYVPVEFFDAVMGQPINLY